MEDSRIKIIHDTNHGPGHARNVGMKAAIGEYIVFIDSDDFVSLDYYSNLYDAINDSGLDVACNDNVMIYHSPEKQRFFTRPHVGIMNVDNKLIRAAWSVCYNKIYRREFLLKINVKFRENCKFEDAYLFYVIFYNSSKVCYVNNGIYYYRQRSDSIMANVAKSGHSNIDVIYVVQAIYDYLINSNKINKYPVPIGMFEYIFNSQSNKKQLFVEIKNFFYEMLLKTELYTPEELRFIRLVQKSRTHWPLVFLYWQKRLYYYLKRIRIKLCNPGKRRFL